MKILFETQKRRFSYIPFLCVMFAASFVWGQDRPRQNRTGRYNVRFSERDPRGSAQEANRRFGQGGRFNPAHYKIDLESESYSVYVPHDYDGSEPYGVIAWIHAGRNGGGIPQHYKEIMDRNKLIWIGANNSGNDRNPYWVRAMLAIDGVFNTKKLYNVDVDRVYVSGISGGGRMSSMVAIPYPDVFTGGAYYVIGCNYMRNLPAGNNRIAPGFWPNPNQKLISAAKKRRYAMITGSGDFNKPGTKLVYEGYQKDGFPDVTYLEQPGLGHALPSAIWFEKGIIALDKPLFESAARHFSTAETAEASGDILVAFNGYTRAAAHGGEQSFQETATSKVAELKPRMDELSEQKLSEVLEKPSPTKLREFALLWKEYSGGRKAAEEANKIGVKNLGAIKNNSVNSHRKAIQKFLKDWGGYPVYSNALEILDGEAKKALEGIRDISSSRTQATKLRRFGMTWTPSTVVSEAFQDLNNLANAQLEMIKRIPNPDQRRSLLITLTKEYANTQAHREAVGILMKMRRK